jgi:hypothetical protein
MDSVIKNAIDSAELDDIRSDSSDVQMSKYDKLLHKIRDDNEKILFMFEVLATTHSTLDFLNGFSEI